MYKLADFLGSGGERLRLVDTEDVQLHAGRPKCGRPAQNGGAAPEGTDDNGHLGSLGNLEHTVAEGLQGAILAGIALRKHGDAGLILPENLDAAQDGF